MTEKWEKFNCFDVKRLPKEVGGIYIYVKPFGVEPFEQIVYVGQTNDFYGRHHDEHLGDNETNIKLKKFLTNRSDWSIYILKLNSNQLNGVEKYIYDEYMPEFNRNSPPGEEIIEVDLPKDVMC